MWLEDLGRIELVGFLTLLNTESFLTRHAFGVLPDTSNHCCRASKPDRPYLGCYRVANMFDRLIVATDVFRDKDVKNSRP